MVDTSVSGKHTSPIFKAASPYGVTTDKTYIDETFASEIVRVRSKMCECNSLRW
jgi:hypothetical protein